MILEKIRSDDEAVFVRKIKKEGVYISAIKTREQRIWVRIDAKKENFDDIFKQFEREEDEKDGKDKELMCVVCIEDVADCVFSPCLHQSTCMECGERLDVCPI